MKTATITLPEPKLSPLCTLAPIFSATALSLLKDDMAKFVTAYTNSTASPAYNCWDTSRAYNALRGAVWMAAYCNLIDGNLAADISIAAMNLMTKPRAEDAA